MSATVSLQQLTDQLDALEAEAAEAISSAADAEALEQLRIGLDVIVNVFSDDGICNVILED